MSSFKDVTPGFAVDGGLTLDGLSQAAREGFVMVINNRPDGEVPGQTRGAELESHAQTLGLTYVAAPIAGMPPSADVLETITAALDRASGPVLAVCGSGTRSIVAWALVEAKRPGASVEQILAKMRTAGYDLPQIEPLLRARTQV